MVEILNSTLILVELVVSHATVVVEISLLGVQTNGLVAPGIFSRVPAAHLHLRPHRRREVFFFFFFYPPLPHILFFFFFLLYFFVYLCFFLRCVLFTSV